MKIIGFSQLRNELSNGNLENWFKCMNTVCDYIYIFDQNSTDGSLEYYKQFPNCIVVESPINRFNEELICKTELLEKVKIEQPDANFIMWMDGDEIMDGRLLKNNGELFKSLCERLWTDHNQGYFLGHKNLWRSDVHERMDDSFDYLDNHGVCKLWKFEPDMRFKVKPGLHGDQYPAASIRSYARIPFCLIHRGFATDYQIMNKYDLYKSNGQSGWALERLLNEDTLNTRRIPDEVLPEWFEIKDDVDPKNKKKIRDIYNEKRS